MNSPIEIVVHRGNIIFDTVLVTPGTAIRQDRQLLKTRGKSENDSCKAEDCSTGPVCFNKRGFNACLVSAYITTLISSSVYRIAALNVLIRFLTYNLSNSPSVQIILIKLRTPKKQFLDYKWSERITQMALERREVDHAMSWLSTLGGAFSALGDEFERCAEIAGKISVKQFELALRLEDPLLAARCRLYAALSLIQRGRYKMPKQIVRNVYKFAVKEKDIRLQNMCHGIWAKLRYSWSMRKIERNSQSSK